MKRTLFTLLLGMLICFPLISDDIRVVINSGHTGQVHSIAVNERENLLFSCGEDGTVRAWDTDTRKLVSLIQLSHYPVLKIILHPTRPQFAAVQKNGINSYQLAVWNWERKTQLYTKELEELPLHIAYSPKGSYILYSKTTWDSLTFLESKSGKKLPYLASGFGIVSHFALSPSENTILTYSPSGRIDYYDIEKGNRKHSFQTRPNLEKICFTANLRFMAASDKERFLFIDLTTGNVLKEKAVKAISTIAANTLTDEIMCLYPAAGKQQLSVFNVSSEEIEEREVAVLDKIIPGTGAFYLNTLYVPRITGDIAYYTCVEGARQKKIDNNTLANVSNLAFYDTRMGFATEGKVVFIDSDFFLGSRYTVDPSYFDVTMHDTHFGNPLALTATAAGDFLLWQQQPGRLTIFNNTSQMFTSMEDSSARELTFSSDLLHVTPYEQSVLTLESNGTCSLFSLPSLEKMFSYTGFGINTAALAANSIFLGKSKASGFNASILHVNFQTGETVPVFDSSILIYEAKYHPKTKQVYTLAVENYGDTTETVLKAFQAPSFRNSRELLSYEGEDLTAHIAFDPEEPEIFTTLGFEGVTAVTERRNVKYRQKEHIPRIIHIHKDFLYTINTDFSITVWSKDSRRRVMDFYIFKDLEWIALLATGKYYASSGAGKYIGVYDGIEKVPSYRAKNLKLN